MKVLKIILAVLAFVVGVGLVIFGQNGVLLAPFGIAQNSVQNLLLEFVGLAILLVELFLYNKKYTKDDVKAKKAAKK